MYQGKSRMKAAHYKLPMKEGGLSVLEEILNDPTMNVLSVHYAQNAHNEKWVLVIYEQR